MGKTARINNVIIWDERDMKIEKKKNLISTCEKGIFFNHRLKQQDLRDFKYLYIGDEFCERCLPEISQVKEVFEYCAEKKMKFVLVTSYMTNKGLIRLTELIEFINKANVYTEIVVNDWGVLKLLYKYCNNFQITLGRLLVSHYFSKFYYWEALKDAELEKKRSHFYCSFPESFLSFLKEKKIFCLEFNTHKHLVMTQAQLKDNGFKTHIHFPYSYLTTSRHCCSRCRYRGYLHISSDQCEKECEKTLAEVNNKYFNQKLFIKGNTYFIRQEENKSYNCQADRIISNDFSLMEEKQCV